MQRFLAICKTKNAKPMWAAYSESQSERQVLQMMNYLPGTFKQAFVNRPKPPYTGENLSCIFLPYQSSLPKFLLKDDKTGEMVNKSYKVPAAFEIYRLLGYLYNNLNVKESIIDTKRD